MKLIVPGGVPPDDVTVAVSEAGCPCVTEVGGPEAVVVVGAAVTTWFTVFEAELFEKFPLPLTNLAVIGCEATESEVVANEATPLPLTAPEPMSVPLSEKITVPIGVPPPEVTVAVNVTDCPKVEPLGRLEDNDVAVLAGVTS
jgi:hypothetical protein